MAASKSSWMKRHSPSTREPGILPSLTYLLTVSGVCPRYSAACLRLSSMELFQIVLCLLPRSSQQGAFVLKLLDLGA
jgi:hypothetical protein